MYGLLSEFRNFIKYKKCVIDNKTFRLHYRYTFSILLIASLLTTANQFIGDNINCMVAEVPQNVIDSFCWIQGTFTIPSQLAGKISVIEGVSAPTGAGGAHGDQTKIDEKDEVHHAWYQWVCFVLFLQAMMCYFPHHVWKANENGKLSMIIEGLDKPLIDEEDVKKHRNVVAYLVKSRGTHNMYAYTFLMCQFLNLFNVLLQVYLMDVFLGYQFTTYGTDVLRISQLPVEERYDPMAKVFPKVTKCTWNHYGLSGSIEIKDAICILSINVINEKIYIILWFWFILLIVWTTIYLIFEILLVFSYDLRVRYLSYICRYNNSKEVDLILRRCNYGDWFLLTQMAKHIDQPSYQKIMLDLKYSVVNKENERGKVSVLSKDINV